MSNPAVSLDAVATWMDAIGLGGGPLQSLTPVGGGSQNIMVSFWRGERRYILRRGPRHLRPRSNDAMRREIWLLGALEGTNVPHPRLVADCMDESVLDGAVFYLMEPVPGFNATVELPPLHASDSQLRREMGFAIVDALAQLSAIDPDAVGLAGFGRPAGFLERQVPRWLAELERSRQLPGYGAQDLPHVSQIAEWLQQRRPEQWYAGILHGDFHLGNVMFSDTGSEVAAIVDWEMATIGDPLLDLGWLLATWPRPEDPGIVGGALAEAGDLPTPDELLSRYETVSCRSVDDADWYVVLACFKQGIVLEGTYARARAGQADLDTGERLHQIAVSLMEQAAQIIG